MSDLDTLALRVAQQQGWKDDQWGDRDYPPNKLPGRIRYGDRVSVVWVGDPEAPEDERDDFSDTGFVIGIPGDFDQNDPYMSGVVFVPWPENPGGKDQPEAEWRTFRELAFNPLCRRIGPAPPRPDAGEAKEVE